MILIAASKKLSNLFLAKNHDHFDGSNLSALIFPQLFMSPKKFLFPNCYITVAKMIVTAPFCLGYIKHEIKNL